MSNYFVNNTETAKNEVFDTPETCGHPYPVEVKIPLDPFLNVSGTWDEPF